MAEKTRVDVFFYQNGSRDEFQNLDTSALSDLIEANDAEYTDQETEESKVKYFWRVGNDY